jgi:hypothetical protein
VKGIPNETPWISLSLHSTQDLSETLEIQLYNTVDESMKSQFGIVNRVYLVVTYVRAKKSVFESTIEVFWANTGLFAIGDIGSLLRDSQNLLNETPKNEKKKQLLNSASYMLLEGWLADQTVSVCVGRPNAVLKTNDMCLSFTVGHFCNNGKKPQPESACSDFGVVMLCDSKKISRVGKQLTKSCQRLDEKLFKTVKLPSLNES